MPRPAAGDDPALAQAAAAQLAPRAWQDAWKHRYAPSPAQADTPVTSPTAARAESNGTRTMPSRVGAESGGVPAAAGAVQARRQKPVPPALTDEVREAARLKALRLNGQRRDLRAALMAGELTLEEALGQGGEAARGIRVGTLMRASPGIGSATTVRLLRAAGVDGGRRTGALTARQRAALVAAVAELTVRRPEHASPMRAPDQPARRRSRGRPRRRLESFP